RIDRRRRHRAPHPQKWMRAGRALELGLDLFGDREHLGIARHATDEHAQILEIAGAKRPALRLGIGHRAVEVENEHRVHLRARYYFESWSYTPSQSAGGGAAARSAQRVAIASAAASPASCANNSRAAASSRLRYSASASPKRG